MPTVGRKKFPYTPAGKRQAKRYARSTGQSMQKPKGYGQGMDRRGGARTGMLSKVNRPSGMRPGVGGRPQSPSRGLGQRPSLGNRKRRRPGSRPNPRASLGNRRGY